MINHFTSAMILGYKVAIHLQYSYRLVILNGWFFLHCCFETAASSHGGETISFVCLLVIKFTRVGWLEVLQLCIKGLFFCFSLWKVCFSSCPNHFWRIGMLIHLCRKPGPNQGLLRHFIGWLAIYQDISLNVIIILAGSTKWSDISPVEIFFSSDTPKLRQFA